MAFLITLGELVTACRQLANKTEGDEQIDIPEWKSHISTRYGRLHSMIADTGARYFETEVAINLADLALPADHRSTIGVDIVYDTASGRRRELPELMIQERNILLGLTGSEARAWSLSGSSLQLFPLPSSGSYRHLYVPQPTRYNASSDSTQIDLITTDGYEAVIWGVASVALHRGESQQQRAIAESEEAIKRLKEWAVMRSQTMPRRQVVSRLDGGYGDINGAWNPASWRYR